MSLRKRSGKSPTHDASEAVVSNKPKILGREVDPGIRPSHAASSLVDYSFILSLVLGGCCAYVSVSRADDGSERSYVWRVAMFGLTNNCSPSTRVSVRSLCSAFLFQLTLALHTGSALTFAQTLFITVQTLPQFLIWPSPRDTWLPRLKGRQVPVHQWILQVLVRTTGSLLNNWAFAFRVPFTVQIVFRSAGWSWRACFVCICGQLL